MKPRCTICGKACTTTPQGQPHFSRHLYGPCSEPRCSQAHAGLPVTMTDVQRVLESQGSRVLGHGGEPEGRVEACPTCHRPFPSAQVPLRVCWDCKQQIRKGDKWHIRQEDQRIVHRNCERPGSYR